MKRIYQYLGLLTYVIYSPLVHAQTVEERVKKLEDKMDKILELLEKQQKEKARPESKLAPKQPRVANPVAKETVLKNGCRLRAYLVTKDSYATEQQGDAIVNIVDRGSSFKIGNFLATSAAKNFERHLVGVKWEGYVNFTQKGKTMFVCEGTQSVSVCNIAINGQNIIKAVGRGSAPALGYITVEEPGLYFVEIWISSVNGYSYSRRLSSTFSIQYSLMGASKMNKITPGTLSYKAEKK